MGVVLGRGATQYRRLAIFSLSHTASAGATRANEGVSWGHELGFGS